MVRLTTLSALAELEQEMARAGRRAEEEALRDALSALAQPQHGVLTAEQAAERLGVDVSVVERWVERGVLEGALLGGRWLVVDEGVERILALRQTLREMDDEGNPTADEILALYRG